MFYGLLQACLPIPGQCVGSEGMRLAVAFLLLANKAEVPIAVYMYQTYSRGISNIGLIVDQERIRTGD